MQPIFADLCRDIIMTTRTGVAEEVVPSVVLSRVDRWRKLLEGELHGMSNAELRGLIGELIVLELDVLPALRPIDAILTTGGPLSAPIEASGGNSRVAGCHFED